MKLPAPPYGAIVATTSKEASRKLDGPKLAAFKKAWPKSWPAYREVLEKLFSDYEHENLLEKKQTQLLLEKLGPKETKDGTVLLLRFSFDHTGITWDIFTKGRVIVHAQPVF